MFDPGEILHQGCSEVYGPRSEAQIQLYQSEMCVHQRDGVPAPERVLHETQPVLCCEGERGCHGRDDPFSGSLPQRVSGV